MTIIGASSYKRLTSIISSEAPQIPEVEAWVRPDDWLELPTVNDGDNKIVGLYAVYKEDCNYCAFLCECWNYNTDNGVGYTVDWGDGNIEDFNYNTQANHKFNYNDLNVNTESSHGYRQAIITITPKDPSDSFYKIYLCRRYDGLSKSVVTWLDVMMAGDKIEIINFYDNVSYESICNTLERFVFIGTSIVNNTSNMFRNSTALQSVTLPAMDNVVDASYMFYSCRLLKYVDMPYKCDLLTSCNQMFSGCYRLKYVTLFDTSKVDNIYYMFAYCSSLEYVPDFNFLEVINATNLFNSCYSLQHLFPLNMPKATDVTGICISCTILKSFSGIFTKATSLVASFRYCYGLESVSLSIPEVETIDWAFNQCYRLKTAVFSDTYGKLTSFQSAFTNCYNLEDINLFDTSNVTSTTSANLDTFYNCAALKTIPHFNFSKIRSLNRFFQNCWSLESVAITTSPLLSSMTNAFSSCYSLKNVELFDTSGVTSMASAFSYCSSLVNVPKFDTKMVANMSRMFDYCLALEGIPEFNTSNVTTMEYMFSSCENVRYIPMINTFFVNNLNMIHFMYSLISVPVLNASRAVTLPLFTQSRVKSVLLDRVRRSLNISNQMLGKQEILNVFGGPSHNVPDIESSGILSIRNNDTEGIISLNIPHLLPSGVEPFNLVWDTGSQSGSIGFLTGLASGIYYTLNIANGSGDVLPPLSTPITISYGYTGLFDFSPISPSGVLTTRSSTVTGTITITQEHQITSWFNTYDISWSGGLFGRTNMSLSSWTSSTNRLALTGGTGSVLPAVGHTIDIVQPTAILTLTGNPGSGLLSNIEKEECTNKKWKLV